MTKNNLKVVKSDTKKDQEIKEKNKALNAAISQIDDSFGKGSVMRLGQQKAMDVEFYFNWFIKFRLGTRNWWIAQRQGYRNLWSRVIW